MKNSLERRMALTPHGLLALFFVASCCLPASIFAAESASGLAGMTNELSQINASLADISSARALLLREINDGYASLQEKRTALEKEDGDVAKIKTRMLELEKELVDLRLALQKKMEMLPEIKTLLEDREENLTRLNDLQTQTRDLTQKKAELERKIWMLQGGGGR